MKKHFLWVVTIIVAMTMVFCFLGCKDPEPIPDTTPPAEVTNFAVNAVNGKAVLNWTNPTTIDFAGVQISMNPAEGILASPVSLGKNATSFTVPGLEVDCTYRFTIKTFDNSQNYSNGATQIITIESNNPSQGDDSSGDSGNDNPSVGGSTGGENEKPGDTDTTAPAQVTNLTAVYDAETLQIIVSWINPEDEDFVGTEISYGPIDSLEPINLSYDKSYSQAIIPGISADDREYYISVKSKDSSGNLSESTYVTLIAVNDEIVVPDGLRTGDFVLTDNTYVRKEYYSELTQEERAKIFGIVLITDSGEPLILGTQFSTNESKWTTSSVGIDTYLSDIATRISVDKYVGYTFTGDLDGSDNWEYICTIDPVNTEGSQVASTYPAFYLANIYASYAGLNGTDFADGWYVPTISELYQMYKNYSTIKSSLKELGISLPYTYDSNLDKYTCRGFWSSSVSSELGNTAYELDYFNGKIDNVDRGTNSNYVWAFHKFNNLNCYTYPVATITSVEIPIVGEGYTGELPVKIFGENLKVNEITCDDATFANVTYIDNTSATATITCTGLVGKSTITVKCGSSSATGTVKVVESEKCFTVGDILFTDGTIIKANKAKYGVPDEQLSKAFAVIGSAPYNGGTGLGVGLKTKSCVWAPENTTGYKTNFTGITTKFSGVQCDYETQTYYGYKFSGDLDGSDNWDYICSVDPEGTKDAGTNYPAFNFANTYGTTAGLTGTDFETGWYVPSVKELYDVYKNSSTIQTSLDVVNGITLGDNYCSSSQLDSNFLSAYGVSFDNGYVFNYYKYSSVDVFVLQAFNSELFTNYEYAEETITSVEIPIAGEGYTGELSVKIFGENLKGNEITCDDVTFANVKYITDTSATATITCTGLAGKNTITIKCGSSSAIGTVKVVEAEKCFTVGDILFTDGTIIKADKVKYGVPDEQLSKAFAVIVSAPYNGGAGLGVGLKTKSCVWAPENTTGYKTNFTGIITEYYGDPYVGYKFSGDLDGSDNWDYICSVDPEGTKDAGTNYPAFNFANTYGTTACLTGTDFETGWYVPSVKELYDVYKNSSTIQTSLYVAGGSIFERSTYWSSSADYYAWLVNFCDGSVSYYEKTLNTSVFVLKAFNSELFTNYESAGTGTVTSVEVSVAGEGYTGELPVKIYGENLKGNELTCDDGTFANVTNIDNTSATATITCTGLVGENTITVKCGSSSATGIVKVVESEKCFTVGDILFTDGTIIKADEAKYGVPYEQLSKAFAVIGSAPYNGGTGLGVGLKTKSCEWAPKYTTGYKTKFTGIITEVSGGQTQTNYGYKFSRDLDGSDNWDYICSVDPEGTKHADTNYPAFNFANTYGTTAGLTGTDFETGWYVPSVKELYDVYKNRSRIQTSLDVVNGITLGRHYLSSSQFDSYYDFTYGVSLDDGDVWYFNKSSSSNVLVLRSFNVE